MGFMANDFKRARLVPRTETLPVPDLLQWFDSSSPEWTVRGLSGNELARCRDMAEKNRKTISAIIDALSSETTKDTVSAVVELSGVDKSSIPMFSALRMELLVAGSVNPPCDIEIAAKLNMAHPTEFLLLTKAIMRLTGLGYVPGK